MSLSKERIERIENAATDILKDVYGDAEIVPPIDIEKAIAKSGLTLKFGFFQDPDIDGAFDRAKRTIFLREDAPYVRQAFTAAHELGHFYLHSDKPAETFYRRDSMFIDANDREQEQEANWFAASILMPRDIITKYWNAVRDVDEIANRFGVSYTAAYWRLKNLRLL